jgi:hypothetical protein
MNRNDATPNKGEMLMRVHRLMIAISVSGIVAASGAGCAARHTIVAATGTSIGVEVSQNAANQSPQAKLGYQRTELAIVPTNRSANEDTKENGAQQHGDVIMELRYGGIFDLGASSGIYQRLAVGGKAVEQAGAALMFSRDAAGNVSADAQKALQALKTVPQRDAGLRTRVAKIARLQACHQTDVDDAIKQSGLQSFNDLASYNFTEAQLAAVESKVSSLEECPG